LGQCVDVRDQITDLLLGSFDIHAAAAWHLLSFKCPDVGAVGSRGPGDSHGAGEPALIDNGGEQVRALINGGAGATVALAWDSAKNDLNWAEGSQGISEGRFRGSVSKVNPISEVRALVRESEQVQAEKEGPKAGDQITDPRILHKN
jgi:hypothetical protein